MAAKKPRKKTGQPKLDDVLAQWKKLKAQGKSPEEIAADLKARSPEVHEFILWIISIGSGGP